MMIKGGIEIGVSIAFSPNQYSSYLAAIFIYSKNNINNGEGVVQERKKVNDICDYCKKSFLKRADSNAKCCSVRCGNLNRFRFLWSEGEECYLVENYSKYKRNELAEILGKKVKQIDHMIRKYYPQLKKQKPPRELLCEYCGAPFTRYNSQTENSENNPKKLNFCSIRCKAEWQSENIVGEKSPSWRGGYFPYFGRNWYGVRRHLRESRDLKCAICGIMEEDLDIELHTHHIIPRRDFDNVEASNYPDNLILLCNKCHKGVENGKQEIPNMSKMWEA